MKNAAFVHNPEVCKRAVTALILGIPNDIPTIESLFETIPHALHTLDPMVGADIKIIKEIYGGNTSLCGKVHSVGLQTDTDDEVMSSAEYCLVCSDKRQMGMFFYQQHSF